MTLCPNQAYRVALLRDNTRYVLGEHPPGLIKALSKTHEAPHCGRSRSAYEETRTIGLPHHLTLTLFPRNQCLIRNPPVTAFEL